MKLADRSSASAPARPPARWASLALALFLAGGTARSETPAGGIEPIPDAVWTRMAGRSWHADLPCPARDKLRLVHVPYIDFKGERKTGELVVASVLAAEVLAIFEEIAADGSFRIERMELIDAYGGDDYVSIEANNTSAFNCRRTTGSKTMSAHAFGRAIDINPLINPYVNKKGTSHQRSEAFDTPAERKASKAAGLIQANGIVIKAFSARGWGWGGTWKSLKDYQHVAKDNR